MGQAVKAKGYLNSFEELFEEHWQDEHFELEELLFFVEQLVLSV